MAVRSCASEHPAFLEMLHHYNDPGIHLLECREKGIKAVGKAGFGVCDELILAAGMESAGLRPALQPTEDGADQYLEYAFTERGKNLFSLLADGGDSVPDYVAFSDSGDVENRLYYYLRELKRSEPERRMPELYLVDWLFSRHMTYQGWNEKALGRFALQLEKWSGNQVTGEGISSAIALYNRQYAAIAKILEYRTAETPRVTGCEALVIIGAKDCMDKERYTQCVEKLAEDVRNWPAAEGTKLFFSGSIQQDPVIYEELEDNGFLVCGEDHDAGMRAFERPIRTELPPLTALVDCCMLRSPTAQKGLVKERVASLLEQVDRVGAACVLFWTDRYDEAASWEYPSQIAALEARGIPYAVFAGQPYPPSFDGQFRGLITALKQCVEG